MATRDRERRRQVETELPCSVPSIPRCASRVRRVKTAISYRGTHDAATPSLSSTTQQECKRKWNISAAEGNGQYSRSSPHHRHRRCTRATMDGEAVFSNAHCCTASFGSPQTAAELELLLSQVNAALHEMPHVDPVALYCRLWMEAMRESASWQRRTAFLASKTKMQAKDHRLLQQEVIHLRHQLDQLNAYFYSQDDSGCRSSDAAQRQCKDAELPLPLSRLHQQGRAAHPRRHLPSCTSSVKEESLALPLVLHQRSISASNSSRDSHFVPTTPPSVPARDGVVGQGQRHQQQLRSRSSDSSRPRMIVVEEQQDKMSTSRRATASSASAPSFLNGDLAQGGQQNRSIDCKRSVIVAAGGAGPCLVGEEEEEEEEEGGETIQIRARLREKRK